MSDSESNAFKDEKIKFMSRLVFLLIFTVSVLTGYNSYAVGKMQDKFIDAVDEMPEKYVTVNQYRCDMELLRNEISILRIDSKDSNKKLDRLIERWIVP